MSNGRQPLADAQIVTRLAHRETGHAGYPTVESLLTTTWTYHRWQAMWQIQCFNALVEPCSDRYDARS